MSLAIKKLDFIQKEHPIYNYCGRLETGVSEAVQVPGEEARQVLGDRGVLEEAPGERISSSYELRRDSR